MVSRRNIRVKVMQTLYSMDAMHNQLQPDEAVLALQKNLEHSKKLFIYLVYLISEIARYAETDALQKSGKHLPTPDDLNINIKIAGNEIIWMVLANKLFAKAVQEYKLSLIVHHNLVKKLYESLT